MSRLIQVLIVACAVLIGSCSASPSEFSPFENLAPDELGCQALYSPQAGVTAVALLGPTADGDQSEFSDDDYVRMRVVISRTTPRVMVFAETLQSGTSVLLPFDDIENGSIIALLPIGEEGSPAVTVRCWRGSE